MSSDFDIVPAGDSVLIIRFAERVDPVVNARAAHAAEQLIQQHPSGVLDVVPTFRSVAVYFDPLRTDQTALIALLRKSAAAETREAPPARVPIEIPVTYGGAGGPDLADVAEFGHITEAEVIRIHSETTYQVFMLGFLPGFAYLGPVDERIAAPRRQTPRTSVPAGSVGIAGMQTGIYPVESPGGWQLVGHTDVRPFDVSRSEPSLFKAGDLVRFVPFDHS